MSMCYVILDKCEMAYTVKVCLQALLNQAGTWFLEIAFVQEVGMRGCVCVRPQAMKDYSCEMKPE